MVQLGSLSFSRSGTANMCKLHMQDRLISVSVGLFVGVGSETDESDIHTRKAILTADASSVKREKIRY